MAPPPPASTVQAPACNTQTQRTILFSRNILPADFPISKTGVAGLCVVAFVVLPALLTFVHLYIRRGRRQSAEHATRKMRPRSRRDAARLSAQFRPLVLPARTLEQDARGGVTGAIGRAIDALARRCADPFGGLGGPKPSKLSPYVKESPPIGSTDGRRSCDTGVLPNEDSGWSFECRGERSSTGTTWTIVDARKSLARRRANQPHIPSRQSLRAVFSEKYRFILARSPSSPFAGPARVSPFPAMSASSSAPSHLISMSPPPAAHASGVGSGARKSTALRSRRRAPGLQRSAGSLRKATRVLGLSVHGNVERQAPYDAVAGHKVSIVLGGGAVGAQDLKLDPKDWMEKENWSQTGKRIEIKKVATVDDYHGLGFLELNTSLSSPQLGSWS